MENTEPKAEPVLEGQPEEVKISPPEPITPPLPAESTGETPPFEPPLEEALLAAPKPSRWSSILVVLLVLILVAGGVLWAVNQEIIPWGKKEVVPTPTPPIPTPSPEAQLEGEVADLEEQGSSDETNAIEADLDNTDFSSLDKELTDIESELETP